MFNVFSYKFNLLNKRAYKHLETRYNVVKKTQNDVFDRSNFTTKKC